MNRLVISFSIISAVILAFLAYPLLALFISLNANSLAYVISSSEVIKALTLSLEAATLSTLILIMLGVPLAYLIARYDFKGKALVEALVDLPLVIPHAVVGIMLLVAFGPHSDIGSILRSLNIILEDSFWAIVAVFTFISAPLLIDSVKDGIALLDPYMEGVARCMGAGPFKAFFTITLPLTLRSLVTGALLSWARAMSEVGALLIIAYYPKTVNVLIVEWFTTYGLERTVALTSVLLSISITVFVVLRVLLKWGRR